jgi:C_GCAxxG_C_C family probable redox protein
MNTRAELAIEKFKKGFNCSQAVFGSYSDQFGLDCQQAFKIAAGFGGGMRMGETCGAVTGAFMVLGLKYGNLAAEDKKSKASTYDKITEYTTRFKARNGSVVCKELLGCDISRAEGMEKAQKDGLFASVCPKMVRDAAEILEDMLMEEASIF